jgi:hypothetical protein
LIAYAGASPKIYRLRILRGCSIWRKRRSRVCRVRVFVVEKPILHVFAAVLLISIYAAPELGSRGIPVYNIGEMSGRAVCEAVRINEEAI